jgi:hypothetical protein
MHNLRHKINKIKEAIIHIIMTMETTMMTMRRMKMTRMTRRKRKKGRKKTKKKRRKAMQVKMQMSAKTSGLTRLCWMRAGSVTSSSCQPLQLMLLRVTLMARC